MEVVAQYLRTVQPGAAAWFGNGGSGRCNQPSLMTIDCSAAMSVPVAGPTVLPVIQVRQVTQHSVAVGALSAYFPAI